MESLIREILIKIGEDLGVNMDLLRDVDKINMDRVANILGKLKKALWILKDKNIAVLGAAALIWKKLDKHTKE